MIKVRGVKKSFSKVEVLKGIDLDIIEGEVVSIVGPSGAGKTTLLQIMGSLLKADSGSVEIAGKDITKLSEREVSRFRNQDIGFVFQSHLLLPEFSASENVAIPGYLAGRDRAEVDSRAAELLELLAMSHRATHMPGQMSGGEQQRVAVARALINSPKVLFADEPSGNLDSKNRRQLHELFFTLRDLLGLTIVIVTHDESLSEMSDRNIEIIDGVIIDE